MFWGLVALSFVFLFDSSTNAIRCTEGYSTTIEGGKHSSNLRTVECSDPKHICHRLDFTVNVLRVKSKNYFLVVQLFLVLLFFFCFLHCPLFCKVYEGSTSSRLGHHTLRSSITSTISLG